MNSTDTFEFVLNGKRIRIAGASPNVTLLEWLRSSGLTGSKEGCAEGDCGACSVAFIDRDAQGNPTFRAINSCLVPLPAMAGREIVTVEGLSKDQPHPLQTAMVKNHGSQCGYCTPGFMMSLFEGYHRSDLKTEEALEEQLCGNLCRCTGYRPIRAAAIEAYATRQRDQYSDALEGADLNLKSVRYEPADGKFLRPGNLKELFSALVDFPDAKLVAGATELGLEITKKFKKFPVLISLEGVREMTGIEEYPTHWHIGASASLTEVQDRISAEHPAMRDMLWGFGSRQIRNRATLGGNLVTASPIGDSAPVLLTYDTQLVLASDKGERTLPIEAFFVSYRKCALLPGEILQTIVLPRNDGFERQFFKVSKRREMDISTVSACFAVKLDDQQKVTAVRIAYGGVSAMPARARKTEAALIGKSWREAENVIGILAEEFTPISDARGSETYRRGLITSLFLQFVRGEKLPLESRPLATGHSLAGACPGAHESAHKHVSGEALYVDDATQDMLQTWPVCSPHARARILKRDASAARAMPGIHAVLLAEDIPGLNDVGAVIHDEVLLADTEISYHGQLIAMVVGETAEICRAAAEKVVVEYDPLPPLLSMEEAVAQKSFHTPGHSICRGDTASALESAPHRFSGEFSFGGQDHFYLETNAAWAECGEDGTVFVNSSTQHPGEVQILLSHVLDLPMHSVVIQSPRMGGGFGGKETQAAVPAALSALAATLTKKRVRVRYNRDQDMMITGKRHPFLSRFDAGFDEEGRLLALRAELYSNAGWSYDLSGAITDRALFHLDNGYYIPNVDFIGIPVKTNIASNTAFRGFGGPQGMIVIEEIMDRIARTLGLPPERVRERNLYHGTGETNTTHYGQLIEDDRLTRVWQGVRESSEFDTRREEIRKWNAAHPNLKRGIAITPVKFGISFTTIHLNQAGALVLLYQDGTAQVNHGATEMGQGVYTNMATIASKELGIPIGCVRVMATRTDKVPNTSATAASCGTDLNGQAVKNACDILNERLAPYRAKSTTFPEVLKAAYLDRVSLSATGFYKTPDIWYDREKGRGKPFHYFAVGAAVTEVEGDAYTGTVRIRRTDILHDAGDPINEGVVRGQIEGGFVQGAGWLTMEELVWNKEGVLLTHSPDTYKIPAIGDMPRVFNVEFLKNATQSNVIHGSKAVGEPPFMLALSVREAIRDMVAAFGKPDNTQPVILPSPATSEAIYLAIQAIRNSN